MKKITKKLRKRLHETTKRLPGQLAQVTFLNLFLVLLQFGYLSLRFRFLNSEIPLWYTLPWGEQQLADKKLIYSLPISSLVTVIAGLVLAVFAKKYLFKHGDKLIYYAITACNVMLSYSLVRIVFISSEPFEPLITPLYLKLFVPFVISLTISYLLTPQFIKYAKNKDFVTDPNVHRHPGMVLMKPSVRGGGAIFSVAFILTVLVFVPLSKEIIGLLVAVFLTAIVGLMDDYANINPNYKLKFVGKPLIRLLILLPIAISPILLAGIQTDAIGNPFNGLLVLDEFKLTFMQHEFAPVAIAFTFLWTLWVMNMLSWSNGIDGQYSGIVGIAAIVIAVLALRLLEIEPQQEQTAKIAVILAGASIGLLPYNWNPSKILWGFGAMSAGLVLASLSIITRAKIATSVIVLLIPFLDGLFTVVRRVLQGKAPYKGDKGHLHHLLLKRGWSVKKTAIFYWGTTALLGIVGILSAERDTPLVILTLGGVVAFFILLVNMSPLSKEHNQD